MFTFHHYYHFAAEAELLRSMAQILGEVQQIKEELKGMSAELDRLKASVTAIKSADESAAALLAGLSQQLKDAIASGDPAALTALADQIDADNAGLAAAVTANTPAAPAPAAAPAEAPSDTNSPPPPAG